MAVEDNSIKEAEAAERGLERRSLLDFLNRGEPAWRDEDHPDIVALGTAEWVRALRNEKSERRTDIENRFSEG